MKTAFLDLDGTLTDPSVGILAGFNYALEKLGHPLLDPATSGWVIGPPLIETFAQLDTANPQQAIDLYREQYTVTGLFQNALYPGIPDALNTLKAQGIRLVLMTAKPHVYARRITAHFGLTAYLDAEYGPELDGTRNNKWELLAHALDEMKIDPRQSVMVGDRANDFLAAERNGMASLGVEWGYGPEDELAQAKARCRKVADLPDAVMQLLQSAVQV